MSNVAVLSGAATAPVCPALRVAIAQAGRIVAEKTVDGGVLGVSLDPPELSVGSQSALHFRFGPSGALSIEGDARGRLVRADGQSAAIEGSTALSLGDRGRLDVGDYVVLFEIVEERRKATRMPLTLRRAPLVDGPFTAIAVGSLMLHFAFVFVLEHMDPPYVATAMVPRRVAELIMETPEPPPIAEREVPIPELDDESTEVVPSERTEVATVRPAPTRVPSRTSPSHTPIDNARLAVELERALGTAVIGTTFEGVGASTPSSESILATMDAEAIAGVDSTLPTRHGGGPITPEFAPLVPTATAGPRPEGGGIAPGGPVPIVGFPDPPIEGPGSGVFDSRTVIRAIQRLRGAMQRCYETQLHTAPMLEGSVDMAFAIQESGDVTNVRAAENTTGDAELASCLVRVFGRIPRFHPGPTGGSVSFTFPIVFERAD